MAFISDKFNAYLKTERSLQNWQNNTNPDRKSKRTRKAEDIEKALLHERNNIKFKKLNGEKQDPLFCAESWSSDAPSAETFSFKNNEATACKLAKEQATLLFACSMDGSEKLKPLTVGKSKNPLCFKNNNANDHSTLPPVTFVNFLYSLKMIKSNPDACDCDDYGVFFTD
ncbi:hypothetical protein RF11_13037 [Thelohanellus kitauei]|uniref:DDE-1 domain-containing protein n=1 Tax=Thelohanellus kitauei TaxID=669202 RepID=A0A0C2J2U5_THEKT|nr:hypothetical protein RF11_13037 [Thelohanellus kitauei]